MNAPALLREVVREYVRSQRRAESCGDTASTVECHLLTELTRADGATQQELANRLMLDKAWISRGIDRLVSAGLVEKKTDASDKRRVQLRLLPAGRARAAALESRLDSHAASMLGHFSPEDERQLERFLEQILLNLDQARRPSPSTCSAREIRYRRARRSDWRSIRRLLRTASLPTEDAADHLDQFTVGTDATGLVAVGGFESHGADALLRSFVVAPALRGQNHGSTLLEHVLRDAADAGAKNVYLLTESAAAFFEAHGFRHVERSDAPDAIQRAREFKELCPASARLMLRSLSTPANTPR
jgi:N-acetylglutamate synthase-like GNAT family acetyltransferase/DNA-binding MarR family transcriptional regulator